MPMAALVNCSGLWMPDPFSHSWIILGKEFMIPEPLGGQTMLLIGWCRDRSNRTGAVLVALLAFPQLMPEVDLLWYLVERWQSTMIESHRFWNLNAGFKS